jgi:hypothetical protein
MEEVEQLGRIVAEAVVVLLLLELLRFTPQEEMVEQGRPL